MKIEKNFAKKCFLIKEVLVMYKLNISKIKK